MSVDLPIYSKRIEEERKSLNLSMKELSDNTSIPYNSIRNYEKGLRKITQKNAEKLADYFKVSVPYIMGLSDFKDVEDMNLFNEQFKQLSQYQSQQVNAIVSNIKSLLIELEKNQDEDTKQKVLDSLTNTISCLAVYSSKDSKKIDNLITTLTYLFDGLRGIYSLRYQTKNDSDSYKNYLVLREQLIKNIDSFYKMNK